MIDFTYYTPTEVKFGRGVETHIPDLIKKYGGSKVLIHYGGGSAERSGLLSKVRRQLTNASIPFVELGGVKPNPRLSLIRQGIELCRTENVDFILAVGGGSVIDSAKAIGVGAGCGTDVWDFFIGKKTADNTLPVGVVLTIPAAGSEMSDGSVVTNTDTGQKRAYGDNLMRPKFAIMNPERTYTLPAYQTSCGATDIMMHTMERYFTHDDDMELTTALAEALLRTVKDATPKVLAAPEDYNLRAQIMWASSLAHNDLTGCGGTGDWATHNLEHELSGMFDVAHGAGLAAIWPHWAEYVLSENPKRFARFAVNVMGIDPVTKTTEEAALEGIEAMKAFYHSIGMPTSIPELIGREATEDEIVRMASLASLDDTATIGSLKVLDKSRMIDIYHLANRK